MKLFESSKANISEHTKHIFAAGELDIDQTVRKFRTVKTEGKKQVSRELEYYNLDLIISIGYRVNSKRGTQFRIWANKILKDYLIKGYTVNENRLKEAEQNFIDLRKPLNFLKTLLNKKLLHRITVASGLPS